MKNSKYINVSVSEKLPEKEGRYFLWVDNPNARNLNSQKLSAEYNMERHFFKNGEFQTFYDTTHYLDQKPDYEDEMKEMLDKAVQYLSECDWHPSYVETYSNFVMNANEFLTKHKTES